MASSISLGVVAANLPAIALGINPDTNLPSWNLSKSKIPDFLKKSGILNFHG
ncbi:MAG: hypothetical protein V7K98_06190 [Nostoc sp.]|uniref:hypothetical protein n=1 Tax=Nostoc sp. TaxID=1180 RepID=UPI002FF8DA7C